MHSKNMWALALGGLALAAATWPESAFAATAPAVTVASSPAQGTPRPSRAHASLRVDVAQTKAWVGQAIPITVTAVFRDVEGATLEGAPQITSKAVVTSELASEPRQSQQIIDGEHAVVARWTGTVTPSSAGPLDLTVDLPVRVRYRDAPPPTVRREVPEDDPFATLGSDLLDPSSIFHQMRRRMQQMQMQLFEQPLGRVHEMAVPLKASMRSLDVSSLPEAGQPATFSGAVGRFDVNASLSTARARVSEPLTLRITVVGDGDLDRVDLAGVSTSDTWKTYPPKATREAAAAHARARKVFEQVLVPLRGGDIAVPPVAFAAFDPASGQYVTRETAPLGVVVEGTSVVSATPPATAAPASASSDPSEVQDEAPRATPSSVIVWKVALGVALVMLIGLGVALQRARGGRRAEHALRREMKRAASAGSVDRFYEAARRLIETRLADRWGVHSDEITATRIHERLGPKGSALADVIAAREALRFGRGEIDSAALGSLCSSVERSLRGAS